MSRLTVNELDNLTFINENPDGSKRTIKIKKVLGVDIDFDRRENARNDPIQQPTIRSRVLAVAYSAIGSGVYKYSELTIIVFLAYAPRVVDILTSLVEKF